VETDAIHHPEQRMRNLENRGEKQNSSKTTSNRMGLVAAATAKDRERIDPIDGPPNEIS
jgi:hypothetical protein